MPKTYRDFLPQKDYAARLALGLVLLVVSQLMTRYPGTVYSILRWLFLIAAVINYTLILISYQKQKEESRSQNTIEKN
ncbi:MAG: hypothetical protein KA449_01815 [Pelolinea sp.]|nr:hypothetical protein [Pelolinea sp.]